MNGNEAFKHFREKKNYTVRQFAALSQLSPRTVSYYENGERLITSMPVSKAISAFGLLGVDIEAYMDEYYPYKQALSDKIMEWKRENPVETNYEILKNRIYLRLAKIKERKNISATSLEKIYELYYKMFELLERKVDRTGDITELDYQKYVVPIYREIKKGMFLHGKNVENALVEEILNSPFTVSEIAELCGVSRQHLKGCINGKFQFEKMRLDMALKLCYVIEIDFQDVFVAAILQNDEEQTKSK